MNKGLKITAAVLALVLLACSTAFSAMAMFSVRALAQEAEQEEGEEGGTRENDVRIAGEYVIRATTAISDAYLSGDSSQLSDRDKETLAMASGILEEIISDGMDPFQKEMAVYDWMTANLNYDGGALVVIPTAGTDSDNPYGVLKYHNAVCVGYATTFRLFMQMLEIPCMVVHNSELYHSWDLVQLDGHWYHVDVYADVGTGDYSNFNLPDSVRQQQQSWDTDYFPAADSMACNVGWQNRRSVDSVYEVPSVLRDALNDQLGVFALSFTWELAGSEARLVDSMVSALDSGLVSSGDPDLPTGVWQQSWFQDEDGSYGLLLTFHSDIGETDDPGVTDPDVDWDQAEQAMQDAFGDLLELSLYWDDYGDYNGVWPEPEG